LGHSFFSINSTLKKFFMATTQEDPGALKDPKQQKGQGNSQSIDREASTEKNNVDNGENQVSNGTQSTPREPGIARVGNTGPDQEERH
jgi:hypothetical protein